MHSANLPLRRSVVCRGLLDLPVVGEVGLVAHQNEGDVVVVLHPQYLISKLLQDNPNLLQTNRSAFFSLHLR